ncbi:hypothetical protein KEM54_006250 [Ascosphaera aggregata]|nr:hypothetical protein KEM54_006250 [Ascosphaera aggregata]
MSNDFGEGRDIRHSINFILADNRRTNNGREDEGDDFDIFTWYDHYEACRRYFLEVAQWNRDIQALCALMNIRLPYQRSSWATAAAAAAAGEDTTRATRPLSCMDVSSYTDGFSIIPYMRRLVATGLDTDSILHGFFGDFWRAGVGHIRKQERFNYLFAAKTGNWEKCKAMYDIQPFETIPFLRIVQGTDSDELSQANERWGRWMLMQDWLIGPDAPEGYMAEL